jgi:putative heme-binding domain-containing protein
MDKHRPVFMAKVLPLMVVSGLLLLGLSCKNNSTENQDPKIAKLKVPSGFHVEHLYSPKEHGQGSWVSMTFDDKGRMITSDQYGNLYRITLPPVGYDTTTDSVKVEALPLDLPSDTFSARIKMGYAHGLLYAFHSLYVMVNDEGDPDTVTRNSGLYRLQDTNDDDVFDKLTLLKELNGRGEHGPHSPVLSPDKKSIYVIAGNFTDIPPMDGYKLPPTWQNDNLFPLLLDPRGFGNDRNPPGGWIAKINPDGSDWQLISAGYRNPFDMAFNEDGELFTYDSDMEWDLGLPWYRPTRICHVTSGSEFGYRENDLKWSPAYPDNLPSILEIGQGSPTNVMSAYNAHFPEKYRKGLFTFDWSYGIIYHIDLIPQGSSYKAKAEEFISGSPLPLTDGAIGPDGTMYFLTGGRKIESDLYRVYYGKNELTTDTPDEKEPEAIVHAREVRKQLEAFQGKPDPQAITTAWPYLKDTDRFIRYAARLAIEHQPVDQWAQKALAEKDPVTLIHAMLALARNGNKSLEKNMLNALTSIDAKQLSASQQTDLFRTIEVTLARMGKPATDVRQKVSAYLSPLFPASTDVSNRILSKVLVYVEDPSIVSKLVPLLDAPAEKKAQTTATQSSDLILRNPDYGMAVADMLANMPPAQHIYYAVVLSSATAGWTPELREEYFKWFYTAFDKYKGGHSYVGYIDEARQAALGHVPKDMLAHYNAISGDSLLSNSGKDLANHLPQAKGPGHAWKVDDALALVEGGLHNRDLEDGKKMFLAARCGTCHRVGSNGNGDIGPDLSQLGTRFSYKDILEAIIDPNETISSQYASTIFYLKDGSSVLGRLIRDDSKNYYVSQNPFAPNDLREVAKSAVTHTAVSKVSIMPPGMINSLNPDELKDLLAFLKSGGNENDAVYKEAK